MFPEFGIDLVLNEEGLILDLPYNRHVKVHFGRLPVFGDFYVARWEKGEIASLTDTNVGMVLASLLTLPTAAEILAEAAYARALLFAPRK
jgi:hypothetical protein